MNQDHLLDVAKAYAVKYLQQLPGRRVFPDQKAIDALSAFDEPLPEQPKDAEVVIEQLHATGAPATVASNGGRYFGFVFGGTLPASLAASWISAAWDQNAVFNVSSPVAARLEKVAARWILELLKLPASSGVGFVTGTTMANFCSILAARNYIYKQKSWDIRSKGINGAPRIRIVTGEEIHASMQRALLMAGIGSDQVEKVPTDAEGRIVAEQMPELDDSTIVCIQAGNVNTGSIDPVKVVCNMAKEKKAWVHIDGAFGLWARVSPVRSKLAEGCELADSWAIDLHKWLNVPYDSGLVICKNPNALSDALAVTAAYLPDPAELDPFYHTPEMSRRARGIETWAAINSLGKSGVTDLIDRCCDFAQLFADNLRKAGFRILNSVTLNQVLVSFGDAAVTRTVVKKIQEEGTCWCGITEWKGITAMRISVSSWMTTREDIEKCSEVIIGIASAESSSLSKQNINNS